MEQRADLTEAKSQDTVGQPKRGMHMRKKCLGSRSARCFLSVVILSLAHVGLGAPHIAAFGPSVRYVGVHGTFSFQVVAYGRNLRYQWWNQEIDAPDGHAIPPSLPFRVNTPRLVVPDVQNTRDYNGWYWCVVTDGVTGQSATSPRGQVFVIDVPTIVRQPQSQTVPAGTAVTFGVEVDAHGPVPVRYQWFFNERPLLGANRPTLSIPYARVRRQGQYSCRVKTIGGTIFSGGAFLTVTGN